MSCGGQAPCARTGHAMCMVHERGIFYVFGGQNERGEYLNDMFSFNMNTREWKKVAYVHEGRLPEPRSLHTLTPIDRSTLVLFAGDTDSGDPAIPRALNDVWVFDTKSSLWQQVHPSASENSTDAGVRPSPRSYHSSVFYSGADLPGPRTPGLYVYGGNCVGRDRETVYRLRLEDFSWEALVLDAGKSEGPGMQSGVLNRTPVPREQHSSVWLPGRDGGLVVFCGDGGLDGKPLSDVWLLSQVNPPSRHTASAKSKWEWRHLSIKMAMNVVDNQVPASAGQSVVQFPVDPSKVLVWGGLRTRGAGAALASNATLIDLRRRMSYAVPVSCQDECSIPLRRVMHALIPWVDSAGRRVVILYGGNNVEGDENLMTSLLPELQVGSVTAGVPASTAAAAHMGSGIRTCAVAGVQAARALSAPIPSRKAVEPRSESPAESRVTPIAPDNLDSSMYEAPIPRGTPLSGRILDQTEVGHFVSVIINGREYKGVLVCNPRTTRLAGSKTSPLRASGNSLVDRGAGASDEAQGNSSNFSDPDRAAKKPRIEPALAPSQECNHEKDMASNPASGRNFASDLPENLSPSESRALGQPEKDPIASTTKPPLISGEPTLSLNNEAAKHAQTEANATTVVGRPPADVVKTPTVGARLLGKAGILGDHVESRLPDAPDVNGIVNCSPPGEHKASCPNLGPAPGSALNSEPQPDPNPGLTPATGPEQGASRQPIAVNSISASASAQPRAAEGGEAPQVTPGLMNTVGSGFMASASLANPVVRSVELGVNSVHLSTSQGPPKDPAHVGGNVTLDAARSAAGSTPGVVDVSRGVISSSAGIDPAARADEAASRSCPGTLDGKSINPLGDVAGASIPSNLGGQLDPGRAPINIQSSTAAVSVPGIYGVRLKTEPSAGGGKDPAVPSDCQRSQDKPGPAQDAASHLPNCREDWNEENDIVVVSD